MRQGRGWLALLRTGGRLAPVLPPRWTVGNASPALAWLLLLLVFGCRGHVESLDACLPEATPALSILAVGDTGDRPEWTPWLDQHLEVGRVMAAEQRRQPAAALLLLGDNFYSEGLIADELAQRIRDNVVTPFCTFVVTDGPRSTEVADACALPPADRTPIPIYAVLGNHDHNTEESPALQRTVVKQFVSNWDMPPGIAMVREMGHGVSLVVIDSEELERGADPAPLKDALLSAKGPWRIVVGHHPVGSGEVGFKKAIATAVEATGVPVQLLLAGHEHNLQIAVEDFPYPSLTAIAGSGSRVRGPRYGVLGSQFLHARPGFARIDLDGEGPAQRLVVSLIETPKHRLDFWSPTRVVACWSVTVGGQVTGASRLR